MIDKTSVFNTVLNIILVVFLVVILYGKDRKIEALHSQILDLSSSLVRICDTVPVPQDRTPKTHDNENQSLELLTPKRLRAVQT